MTTQDQVDRTFDLPALTHWAWKTMPWHIKLRHPLLAMRVHWMLYRRRNCDCHDHEGATQ